jgi:beta-glucosidase
MQKKVSRRTFAKIAGTAAVLSSTAPPSFGSPAEPPAASGPTAGPLASSQAGGGQGRQFPPGFLWGTATASYQAEGAAKEDGRGPSIWDTFSHTPGKVANNDTGDVSTDHYHRYKEDVQLMKSLGCKAYRFSIAWPRIFPEGTGAPNPKGLEFYSRLVDELLANGIQPFATLFHWDLPQAIQDRFGGWEKRDAAKAFADYAGYVAEHLSDRIKHFFTINEFTSYLDLGYENGQFAPGLKLSRSRLYQLRHNAVLGHGMAVQAIRATAKPGTKVGLAENIRVCVPVIENEEHIQAARRATREMNAPYMTVVQEGRYTDAYLAQMGADAPKITPEDLKIISSPLDCAGLNVYQPWWIRAADNPLGFEQVPYPPSHPHMLSSWLFVGPEAIYWAVRNAAQVWNIPELYITENGCSSTDIPAADGRIYDVDRVMYLRNYLTQLQRAAAEGLPIKGYFVWSLLDNFEWASGYSLRFGIYHVDYKTLKRTPKLSAELYREIIARNALA